MKKTLTESELKQVIKECADRILFERKIKKIVNEVINEEFSNYDSYNTFESNDGESDDRKSHSKGSGSDKKRQKVIQALSQPGVDVAQYAYRLWDDKDKDSCRSYFYKCLNGEKDDNGNAYEFSNDEINSLYSLLSDEWF